jgi:hypothetical protein
MIDTKEIARSWGESAARIRKPKLEEACKAIGDLLCRIGQLEAQLDQELKKQKAQDQQLKVMFVELQNVLVKYGKQI